MVKHTQTIWLNTIIFQEKKDTNWAKIKLSAHSWIGNIHIWDHPFSTYEMDNPCSRSFAANSEAVVYIYTTEWSFLVFYEIDKKYHWKNTFFVALQSVLISTLFFAEHHHAIVFVKFK